MFIQAKLSEVFARVFLWFAVLAFSMLAFIPNLRAGLEHNWTVQETYCDNLNTQTPLHQEGHRIYFDFSHKSYGIIKVQLSSSVHALPEGADRLIVKIPFRFIAHKGKVELGPTGDIGCALQRGTNVEVIRCPSQFSKEFTRQFKFDGTYLKQGSSILYLMGNFSTEIFACKQGEDSETLVPVHSLGLVKISKD